MSIQNPNEIWQVEVGGQVYEAAFAELGSWIGEGALHPGDKVRRGNLRWIEARRVPSLVPFFNAKEKGEPMPVIVSSTESTEVISNIAAEPVVTEAAFDPGPSADPPSLGSTFNPSAASAVDNLSIAPAPDATGLPDPNFCAIHTDVPSAYLCDGCGSGLCKACPNSYGGTVRICSLCGAMCRALGEAVQKRQQEDWRAAAIQEGFGATDFFNALGHPFKFKTSLIIGAVMFMAFSLGQNVSTLGGIYMAVAAIFSLLLANMLTFGVLSNTVENFAEGNLEANFMPDFEDFNLWDSVVHPFFLSIGAYLSSFGPFFLVLIVGFYLVVSSVSSQMESFQQDVEKIPGTKYYDTKRTLDQSETVKGVLGNVNRAQTERLDELGALDEEVVDEEAGGEVVEDQARREMREQEELWEMAQKSRTAGLEAAIGKSPETEAKEREAMMQQFLGLAPPLVVIGGIFFLWGMFYFPAACTVAGYTRSFTETINPLVGLDTIKRLGSTYVSILFMGLALLIAYLLVGFMLAAIFFAFELPGFGNLPAKALGALFSFYLWSVFSCVLGYAIFKRSDVLRIKT